MADQAAGNQAPQSSGNSSEPSQRHDGGSGAAGGSGGGGGGGGRNRNRRRAGRGRGAGGNNVEASSASQQPGDQQHNAGDDNHERRGGGGKRWGGKGRAQGGHGLDQEGNQGAEGAGGRGGRGGRGGGRGNRHRPGSPRGQRNKQPQEKEGQTDDAPEGQATEPTGPKFKGFEVTPANPDNECVICAGPLVYHSIAPCNHQTCHICALRMRALYKNKACSHCRVVSDHVVFSLDSDKKYEDFTPEMIVKTEDNLGIKFSSMAIYEDTVLLLRYNCPDPNCDVACMGWPDLHRHVRNIHQQRLCDLCTKNKKVFCHEHTLFNNHELSLHEKYGDDKPGSSEQSGFRGHPECEFCRRRFYGSDEIYQHCKEHHETCFICDRNSRDNNSGRSQWFLDFSAVQEHFKKDHFQCPEEECLEKKFEVWETEFELRKHQQEHHPKGLTSRAIKDSRKIDLTKFAGLNQPSNHGRDGRGRGRGQRGGNHQEQGNAGESSSSAGGSGLNRAEEALRRQMQVQSAQSVTTRQFGSQMSAPAAPTPAQAQQQQRQQQQQQQQQPPAPQDRGAPGRGAPGPGINNMAIPAYAANPSLPDAYQTNSMVLNRGRQQNQEEAFPALANLNIRDPPRQPQGDSSSKKKGKNTPLSSSQPGSSSNLVGAADEARERKHGPVIARASFLLRNEDRKIARFRAYLGRYNEGSMNAKELIDAFWSLFDVKAAELGTLLREVADIYEDENKAIELRKAWNAWRAVNEDYPPITGMASSAAQASAAGHAGSRVLSIKSATTKSLKSGKSPWGAVSSGGSTSSSNNKLGFLNPTPSVNRAGAGRAPATPWAGAAGGGSTSSSSSRPGPATSSGSRVAAANEFPSLPPKQLFPNGYGPVARKHEGVAPASVWGSGGGAGTEDSSTTHQTTGTGGGGGDTESTKKKGKKKQTLMHFG